MKNYFIQIFFMCYRGSFLFIGVNGTSFVRRSSDIWVTESNYVESNFYVEM